VGHLTANLFFNSLTDQMGLGKVRGPDVVRLALAKPCGPYAAGCHEFEMATPKGRYDAQLIDFAEIVRGEKPNPYPSSHELAVQLASLAASGVTTGDQA